MAVKKQDKQHVSAFHKVQIARHPNRPYTLDYINLLFSDFTELCGDRLFGNDKAIVCGLAFFEKKPVVVIGQQKGKNLEENMQRNFGSMHPEGYRKALRVMKIGEKFGLPVISFIDTSGAYPGIGAEERGQAEAIARNLREMALIEIPTICIVIGEGGSGGALGIGVTDRILMLENAWYSVISPEGCAAILWSNSQKSEEASLALKLTANDLLKLGVIDEIIQEAPGGAHTGINETAANVRNALTKHLEELRKIPIKKIVKLRYDKYRKLGKYLEKGR